MEDHTTKSGSQNRSIQEAEVSNKTLTNNGKTKSPQLKGKEESPGRVVNGIEVSKLLDTEFKTMVIKKLKKLSDNYQKLQGTYKELTTNYTSMKKEIETINKSQEGMKNTVSELKSTVEGIESRLDEAEDQISKQADKVGKKLPGRARKGKKDSKRTK